MDCIANIQLKKSSKLVFAPTEVILQIQVNDMEKYEQNEHTSSNIRGKKGADIHNCLDRYPQNLVLKNIRRSSCVTDVWKRCYNPLGCIVRSMYYYYFCGAQNST